MSLQLSKQTEGQEKPRKISKGWPPKRRREQAARIRRQKPWLKSTGPRTPLGKSKIRFNALTHGKRRYVWRELRHVLKLHRRFLKDLAEYHFYKNHPRRLKANYYKTHPHLRKDQTKKIRQRRAKNDVIAQLIMQLINANA